MVNAQHQTDIEGLLALAHDKSVESRTRLVKIVGDLFFESAAVLSDRERSLMSEILRRLIHDVEMSVRQALAQRLAREPNSPHDLIKALANDEIEVAYPILLQSSVLQDMDLIEVIHQRTLQHQLAIARRSAVSEKVSEALVEAGHEDVIKALLGNENAEIAQSTIAYLVEESRRVDAYQNPLLHRRELKPELARRMYLWVSAALREHIVKKFNLDAVELERKLAETLNGALAEQTRSESRSTKSAEIATQLAARREITPKLLIQTLRQGEVSLFEDLLAKLTGLRTQLVRRFIFEPGGQGLAIACRGVNIDKAHFASIFLLSRGARPGDKVVDPGELSQVLAFYEGIKPETARKVVERWRVDPDFLFALKQVATGRTASAGTVAQSHKA
jgi:uncharacterized protein (DUF2336 family)